MASAGFDALPTLPGGADPLGLGTAAASGFESQPQLRTATSVTRRIRMARIVCFPNAIVNVRVAEPADIV